MGDIDQDLKRLLAGEALPEPDIDICFLKPEELPASHENLVEMLPVVKQNVGYIAMALIFNEEAKMCLIQEAKRSCRGLWYIPAGRVEPGENFIDGVKREVLEEAGIEFSPLTLLCVENFRAVNWFRLVYVAKVTGAKLKTPDDADEESIQAQWFSIDEIMSLKQKLRAKDFFQTMKFAQEYLSKTEGNRHPIYHIGIQPHHGMLHRPVLVRNSNGATKVLCYKKNGASHFPCCQMSLRDGSFLNSLFYVFRDVYSLPPGATNKSLSFDIRGILTLEHCGIPACHHDGMCITTVIRVQEKTDGTLHKITNSNYEWQEIVDQQVLSEFQMRITRDGMLIPLIGG